MKKIKKNTKRIIITLVAGLMLTLASLAYARQTVVTRYNDCVGLCATWFSAQEDFIIRGYPMVILSSPEREPSDTEVKILGALADWAVYSSLIFIALLVLTRRPSQP